MYKNQYRNNKGKFGSKKRDESRKKQLKAMSAAKKKKLLEESKNNILDGNRIINLKEFGRTLKCMQCKELLDFEKCTDEKREGLYSIFTVPCDKCNLQNAVSSGTKEYYSGQAYSAVNSSAVLGAVHAGLGHTALKKLFTCMNIPDISIKLYKKYEKEVGQSIEEAAKDSCKRAAEEERMLVLKSVEKISNLMPPHIVKELYPSMQTLQSSLDNRNINSNDVNNNNNSSFDEAVGNIVNIIISYDMGWSRRGNGKSYDSLNGYGTMIGFLSGKILDYTTRNRKCAKCDSGNPHVVHDCRKNFSGSAKAMEADAGAYLVNDSPILKECNLKVKVIVGDDDSSMIAAVKKNNSETIFKLSDKNHLVKNFSKELYNLANTFKELKKKGVILHIKKCFSYAISQNKCKSSQLASVLISIPDHLYGRHENCSSWCTRKESTFQTVQLVDEKLYDKLCNLFTKYANNASKFSFAASSQANESVNNIIAQKAPKRICYSRSAAADYRVACAVCSKNDGDTSILNIKDKLLLSPGTFTKKNVFRSDKLRHERAVKEQGKAHKLRRIQLTKNRENLRKVTEKHEGLTYKSNHGIQMHSAISEKTVLCNDTVAATVYFDLEMTGLSMDDVILQIGARWNDCDFSIYVTPTRQISKEASKITGLVTKKEKLYLYDKELVTLDVDKSLNAFLQFLCKVQEMSKQNKVLLAAHNVKFDAPRLIKSIVKNNLHDKFSIIEGFADTISVFKEKFPSRKGRGMFQLSTLAKDILQSSEDTGCFHDALYDVVILQKLIRTVNSECELVLKTKTYDFYLSKEFESQQISKNIIHLSNLEGIISKEMLKRLAVANVSYDYLQKMLNEQGEDQLADYLKETLDNGKPRLTKDKRILSKIIANIKNK